MVRFDRPCIRVAGAVEYFREHMVVGDYLTQEGSATMTWVGSDAQRLGLSGRCSLDDFERLCGGFAPSTGERLMMRDKGDMRRVCFFAQLSPPKDVSVLHLVGGDERIAQWWQDAVAETLRELEALTATRVRRDGQNSDRQTGTMAAAIVTHDTNRALDPQLHTHVCLMNVTFDRVEGRWKGVQPSGFFRHQGFLREVCYNKLAAAMVAAGYEIESSGRIGFAVKDFPAELRETFSKRRKEILRRAQEAGVSTQDALQAITTQSRAAKTTQTAGSLRQGWEAEAGPHLDQLRRLVASARSKWTQTESLEPLAVLQSAEAHVFERSSVVADRHLLREALRAGRARTDLHSLRRALAARERSGDLIRVDEEIASRAGLEAEREFTAWAGAQRRRWAPLGVGTASGLEGEQAGVVRDVLGTRAGVAVLEGDAGTGKTTCLKHIVAGIEAAGGSVFGCAPSSSAAEVLRRELTPQADTLQLLLVSPELQQRTRDRVLLVDEAGLVSVSQMRDLCRLAAANGNRLLLVGDPKQHSSIEAGDALRCLQEFANVPVFRLTEIRRQKDPGFRKAVSLLARGNALAAFDQFARIGAVREVPDEDRLWREAADDYVHTVAAGKSCLAISPVWAEIRAFSAVVRERLRAAGAISGADRTTIVTESWKWTREERRRIQSYRTGDILTFFRDHGEFRKLSVWRVVAIDRNELVISHGQLGARRLNPRLVGGFDVGSGSELTVARGDRLLIRASARPARLRNGEIVDVAGIDESGAIALKDGRTIPAWFREFTHGYCATSHASQGKTVDRGLLLMGAAGIAAGSLRQAYVSNSRFRESHAIYTSAKEEAREAMARAGDRRLAMELVSTEAPRRRSWRARWAERLGLGAFRPAA